MGRNGFERSVEFLEGRPLLLLVVLAIVPFLVVNAVLSPLSGGTHGMTHSDHGNDIWFDGTVDGVPYNGSEPPTSGHFRGDVTIGDNTGWVICNGEVRFSGKLVIRDAELDYTIRSNRSVKGPGNTVRLEKDYQHIDIDGISGDMEGGVPVWYLGSFGTAVGISAWAFWFLFKRRTGHDKLVSTVLLGAGLICLYNVFFFGPMFTTICVAFVAVPALAMFSFGIYKSIREDISMMDTDLRLSGIPEVLIIVGVIVLIISTGMVVHAGWGSFDGYMHDPGMAWRNLIMGIAGLLIGGAQIGFGFGKRLLRKRSPRSGRPTKERSRSKPDDEDEANVYGLKDYRPLNEPPRPPEN